MPLLVALARTATLELGRDETHLGGAGRRKHDAARPALGNSGRRVGHVESVSGASAGFECCRGRLENRHGLARQVLFVSLKINRFDESEE